MESKHDTLSDGKKEFDPMALGVLWIILAAVCVICGCPPINRPMYIQYQAHDWKMETFDGLSVSATNGLGVIDMEGGSDD